MFEGVDRSHKQYHRMGASTDACITFKHGDAEMIIFPKDFSDLNLGSGIPDSAKGLLFTGPGYIPTNMIPAGTKIMVLPQSYNCGMYGIPSSVIVYFHMGMLNRDLISRDCRLRNTFRTYSNLKGETDTNLLIRLYNEATKSQTKVTTPALPVPMPLTVPMPPAVPKPIPASLTSQQLDDLIIKSMDKAAQQAATVVTKTISDDAAAGTLHTKTHYDVMEISNEKAAVMLVCVLSKYLPQDRLCAYEKGNIRTIKLRLFE